MDERRKLDVTENMCLRSVCGVTRIVRLMNEEMRRRIDVGDEMTDNVERNVLKLFGPGSVRVDSD